jgi:hypothetical protein
MKPINSNVKFGTATLAVDESMKQRFDERKVGPPVGDTVFNRTRSGKAA